MFHTELNRVIYNMAGTRINAGRIHRFVFLCVILSSCIFPSCTKEAVKNSWAAQEKTIENFLNSMTSKDTTAYVINNKGTERLVITDGQGEELGSKGTVSFYYAGYILKGSSVSSSNLFSTNNKDIATSASWNLSDTTAFNIETINLGESDLIDGLRNGLVGVKGGEECYIVFSSRYGYGKKIFGTIPSNSALAYHIWVESVSND